MDIHDPLVIRLAKAIAHAEGYGPLNNLPTRINNPGDMELGDLGYGVQAGKTIFRELDAGWEHLYFEVWLMLNGKSHVYSPNLSLIEIAAKYTGNDNAAAWASIVAQDIGISVNDQLKQFLSYA